MSAVTSDARELRVDGFKYTTTAPERRVSTRVGHYVDLAFDAAALAAGVVVEAYGRVTR